MKSQIVKPYEKYMIVLIDILGFKDKVNKCRDNERQIQDIVNMFRLTNKLASLFTENPWARLFKIEVNIISDSIGMTCRNPDINAAYLLMQIASFWQVTMAREYYFVRGSVIIDSHYHEKNIAFGPAVIKALEMEKLAGWPRVVIAPNLLQQVDATSEKIRGILADLSDTPYPIGEQDLKNYIETAAIERGCEGLQYVNYLRVAFTVLTPMKWVLKYGKLDDPEIRAIIEMDLWPTHRDAIVAKAKSIEPKDDIEKLMKYHSLAVYHNNVIDTLYKSLSNDFDDIVAAPTSDFNRMLKGALTQFRQSGVSKLEAYRKEFLNELKKLWQQRDKFAQYKIALREVFPQLYE